jgi:hypothetical protein
MFLLFLGCVNHFASKENHLYHRRTRGVKKDLVRVSLETRQTELGQDVRDSHLGEPDSCRPQTGLLSDRHFKVSLKMCEAYNCRSINTRLFVRSGVDGRIILKWILKK